MLKRGLAVVLAAALVAGMLCTSGNAAVDDKIFCMICARGTPQEVRKAIDKGADIHARDDIDHGTALMWAASENNNPAVTQLLIDAGARVDATDNYGWTALMSAAYSSRNPEVLEVLLDAGADPDVQDVHGKGILDWIQYNDLLHDDPIIQKLRKLQKASP
ncbi:MAG: ankyrin repeat domain-containing protein [Synergistales bacterium]|nr:ankyrin repeat domain-containing protein [Synergistales bacterium]